MSASYLCPQGQKQVDNSQQKKSRVTPHSHGEGWQLLWSVNTSGQDQLRCTAHQVQVQVQVHLSVQL